MTEIEKLYENAGFKKDLPINLADLEFSEEDCDELCLDNSCDECRYKTYPPFTAEKQIELIKFISGWNMFLKNVAGQFNIATGDNAISYYAKNLEDVICLCINSKWQFMNYEEKEQIKEILNG